MNSGAVQLVEYFHRIDFLAESTFVLLTLSFVHLLAPPRVRRKRKGASRSLHPRNNHLFSVFEVVGEHSQAAAKLRYDHNTTVKWCGFLRPPIEPIGSQRRSGRYSLQTGTARSYRSFRRAGDNYPIRAGDRKRPEADPRCR